MGDQGECHELYGVTLTFHMAALVTFLADRFPFLNDTFLSFQLRTLVAVGLTCVTGWLVNRGPDLRTRSRNSRIIAVGDDDRHDLEVPYPVWICKRSVHLGRVRILALMTGVRQSCRSL